MKIVINNCYGGFSLSDEACEALGLTNPYATISRCDPKLIELVQTMGERINGECAELAVATIPDEATDWQIQEYDGVENVIYVLDGEIRYAYPDEEEDI